MFSLHQIAHVGVTKRIGCSYTELYRNRGHTIRIEFLAIRTPVAPRRDQSRDDGVACSQSRATWAEIWASEKVDWVGRNESAIFRRLWTKVHQIW